jgi:hypothetical protein
MSVINAVVANGGSDYSATWKNLLSELASAHAACAAR